MRILFSLVCVTYERVKEVDRLFLSLSHQSFKNFEIIIIDQNIDGKIDHLVNKYRSDLRIQHIKVEYNNNTKSRNKGINAAKGNWLVFPDDDCWYGESVLEKVSLRISSIKNADVFCTNWADPLQNPKVLMYPYGEGEMTKTELFEYAACICLFVKKEVLATWGGFNEKLGLGSDTVAKAGEEQELLLRLKKNKVGIYKAMDIEVYHRIGNRQWNTYFEQRVIGSGATDYYLTSKYWGKAVGIKKLIIWTSGAIYNLLRFRRQNFKWYFLKLKGAIFLSGKIRYEPAKLS